jgi:hypothetical protein
MVNRAHKGAAPSNITVSVQALAAKMFAQSASLRRRIRHAGEIADFIDWQTEYFGRTTIFRSRELLWSALSEKMHAAGPWHGIEFGVAWGYATSWWLDRFPGAPLSTWDGFDRFTGLPRAWREHQEGTFDASGRPPDIEDQRLAWHVGDVEVTIHALEKSRISSGRRLILFDLDLYEPTARAWAGIETLLEPGDLLYFDEAFDEDERRVLLELVLPARNYEYVGCTSLALGLQVAG